MLWLCAPFIHTKVSIQLVSKLTSPAHRPPFKASLASIIVDDLLLVPEVKLEAFELMPETVGADLRRRRGLNQLRLS